MLSFLSFLHFKDGQEIFRVCVCCNLHVQPCLFQITYLILYAAYFLTFFFLFEVASSLHPFSHFICFIHSFDCFLIRLCMRPFTPPFVRSLCLCRQTCTSIFYYYAWSQMLLSLLKNAGIFYSYFLYNKVAVACNF